MNTPTFLINNNINICNRDHNELCKDLFKQGILSKLLDDDNLILIYNKYDDSNMSDLKYECRSLVLDKKTLEMKSYSCETPRVLTNYDHIQNLPSTIINISYEGTLLSVFYHNNKWYVSTRRCLNSKESVFSNSEINVLKSHFDMFEEVLLKAGYNDFENFSKCLDITKSYYFVLIHHENKHIIDYSYKFEDGYTYLALVSIKDNYMNEINIYEKNISFINKYIFLPEKLGSIEEFTSINERNKYNTKVMDEGLIIKEFSSTTNKYSLYKLQTDNYKLAVSIGNDQNMYKGLIHLYQHNKLTEYFDQNSNSKFIRIINPTNTRESYFSTIIVDSTFRVCTSELFELFKILCSLKTGKNQNKELYELLPKEYKDMIYCIRGIYYKKKAVLFESANENLSDELKKSQSHLKISDIYYYLKKLSIDTIVNFLKARKLMFNWVNLGKTNESINEFGKISHLCNKVHLKHCAIFTNKLYPNITFTDFPETKKV